jgi:hypothetical protein
MAVFVVLSFEDEEVAKEYVKDHFENYVNEDDACVMEMVIKKPTQFCECTASSTQKKGFVRGMKYGWWVHSDCGKPTKAWAEGYFHGWELALGTNLLPPELRTTHRAKNEGKRSEMEWRFLLGASDGESGRAVYHNPFSGRSYYDEVQDAYANAETGRLPEQESPGAGTPASVPDS